MGTKEVVKYYQSATGTQVLPSLSPPGCDARGCTEPGTAPGGGPVCHGGHTPPGNTPPLFDLHPLLAVMLGWTQQARAGAGLHLCSVVTHH